MLLSMLIHNYKFYVSTTLQYGFETTGLEPVLGHTEKSYIVSIFNWFWSYNYTFYTLTKLVFISLSKCIALKIAIFFIIWCYMSFSITNLV